MQCPEFESRLHTLLDERRDPAADTSLSAHAANCEPCQELLDGQVAVVNTMARLKRAGIVLEKNQPPVRARLAASSRPFQWPSAPPPASRWRLAAVLKPAAALAAPMLLALGVAGLLRGHESRLADVPLRGNRVMPLGRSAGTLAMVARGRPTAARSQRFLGGDWLLEAPRLPEHFRTYRGTLGQLALALPTALEHLEDVDLYAPGFNNLRASLGMIWHTLVYPFPSTSKADDAAPKRTTRSRDPAFAVA